MKAMTKKINNNDASISGNKGDSASNNGVNTNKEDQSWIAPTSLAAIEKRIAMLLDQVPTVEETLAMHPTDLASLQLWSQKTYGVLKSFRLLKLFIKPAVYKWASDTSGSGAQNVANLEAEATQCENLLTQAASCCLTILYPNRELARTKKMETVQDNNSGPNGDELFEDSKSVATVSTDEASSTDSGMEEADGPRNNKRRKIVTTHYTFEDVVKSHADQKMYHEMVCVDARDKRELMIVALKTLLKAFRDYHKASANDSVSRSSGMMMM